VWATDPDDWPISEGTNITWLNRWWLVRANPKWWDRTPRITITVERTNRPNGFEWIDEAVIKFDNQPFHRAERYRTRISGVGTEDQYGIQYNTAELGSEQVALMSANVEMLFITGWTFNRDRRSYLYLNWIMKIVEKCDLLHGRLILVYHLHGNILYVQHNEVGPEILFVDHRGRIVSAGMFSGVIPEDRHNPEWNPFAEKRFLIANHHYTPEGRWADAASEYLVRESRIHANQRYA